MKLSLVSVRAPAAVAAAPPTKRSFTSTWEAAVRRWLWGRPSKQTVDLDDVAREVFVRYSGYSDATLLRCPQTFVLKVAANVVDEWCGVPRNEWLEEEETEGKERSGAEKEQHQEELVVSKPVAKQMQAAIDQLPLRQRQVLLMHVNEGLTYEEIAKRVRMTPAVVRRELVRAYAQVRCRLDGMGVDGISKK